MHQSGYDNKRRSQLFFADKFGRLTRSHEKTVLGQLVHRYLGGYDNKGELQFWQQVWIIRK